MVVLDKLQFTPFYLTINNSVFIFHPSELIVSQILRLNVRSDPVVQFFAPKVVCKLCEREGHSKISCDYASSKVGPHMSYEDSVFWMYVHPCDRPKDFDL